MPGADSLRMNDNHGRHSFAEYLRRRRGEATTGGGLSRRLKTLVPHDVRLGIEGVWRGARDNMRRTMAPAHRAAAKRLYAEGRRRLHLGCGAHTIPRWINVDLRGQRADIYWDLRKRLPFEDASIEAIFHEHLLEHLVVEDAYRLTRDCGRILQPGGILRIGVPDFRRYAESYLGGEGLADAMYPRHPTRLLSVTEVVYGYRHRSLWDVDTLELLLREAGFAAFRVSSYGASSLGQIERPERALESLYVEGVK